MKLSENAIQWLANGERGLSSETIFATITGMKVGDYPDKSHPYDPGDLRRCRLLLDACPEIAERLSLMALVSSAWAALTPRWQELCAVMDEETPNWRTPSRFDTAPRPYDARRARRTPETSIPRTTFLKTAARAWCAA
jgi:hypothetical protein